MDLRFLKSGAVDHLLWVPVPSYIWGYEWGLVGILSEVMHKRHGT